MTSDINALLSKYLADLGFTGSLADSQHKNLVQLAGREGSTPDLLKAWLRSLGYTGGVVKMMKDHLESLGYSGSLAGMLQESYLNQDFFGEPEPPVVPVITVQPTNQSVTEGADATFSVTATVSEGSLAYQWQVDTGTGWVDVSGATSNTYTAVSTELTQDGYLYRVVVTAVVSGQSVASASATLSVEAATVGTYVGFVPSGYASQAAARVLEGSDSSAEVTFRRNAGTVYLLGHSDNSSTILYATATQIVSSSGGPMITLNYATNTTDFYRVVVDRAESSSSITIYSELGTLLASQTGTLASGSFTYIARQSGAYSNVDVKQVKVGSLANRNEHVWNTEPVGGVWQDTGTVGGWNFTLAGSPLPTWE